MLLFIFLFGQSDARQRLHLPLRTKLSAQRKESDSYGSSKNELTKVDHLFLSEPVNYVVSLYWQLL